MYINKFVAFMAICVLSFSQAYDMDTKKPFSLEKSLNWLSKSFDPIATWISDSEFYYFDSLWINSYNVEKYSKGRIMLNLSSLNELGYNDLETIAFSVDYSQVLIRYDATRRAGATLARCDVVDLTIQQINKIYNGTRLQYCDWHPINDRIVFVYENNVFIRYDHETDIQITTNGESGSIYNGVPDLVYGQEIFTNGSAMWWSTDGNFLAIAVFDDTEVETVKHFVYGETGNSEYLYPEEIDLKYPRAGTANPKVSVKVFDMMSEQITHEVLSAPDCDSILKSVVWTRDNQLLITWLNRRQNKAKLLLCSVKGVCNLIKRLVEPSGWIEIGTPICLKNSSSCIFSYWVDDASTIWNLDLKTGENLWEKRDMLYVMKLYGYDEVHDIIYYRGILKKDRSQYHVFGNTDCITCNLIDSQRQRCLSAEASFSKDFSYYLAFCTGPNPPYASVLKTRSSRILHRHITNVYYGRAKELYIFPAFEVIPIPLTDGTLSMAKVVYPKFFVHEKKYPMIVHVSGRPNSVSASNEFHLGFEAYMATNHDVFYALIDVRGSGNKGKTSLFSVNNHLGEFEVEDIMFATIYLQNNITSVDKDRCAIWGKGYGGYLTALVLANDDGRLFECGISVAPITSWLHHNSFFAERYMGKKCDNFYNYLNNNISQNVENFRNHQFLLIHGTADVNVLDQHSLMLARALQKNNIMFEQLIYTDENHKFERLNLHLYHSMEIFFSNCFNLDIRKKSRGSNKTQT